MSRMPDQTFYHEIQQKSFEILTENKLWRSKIHFRKIGVFAYSLVRCFVVYVAPRFVTVLKSFTDPTVFRAIIIFNFRPTMLNILRFQSLKTNVVYEIQKNTDRHFLWLCDCDIHELGQGHHWKMRTARGQDSFSNDARGQAQEWLFFWFTLTLIFPFMVQHNKWHPSGMF